MLLFLIDFFRSVILKSISFQMNRLLAFIIFFSAQANAQEIALTFDDAPTADGPVFSGQERTQRIIKTLRDNDVSQVAFFVATGNITPANVGRLVAYAVAGHLLANHSHSHTWLHQQGARAYLQDVKRSDSILNRLPGYVKWFRYPFLDEGRSVAARDSVRAGLRELHLANGYVTVDNYDWYINHLLHAAKEKGQSVDFGKLKKIYIDHIYHSIQFYDGIARKHLGRSPKHVLLLHENDLSALFLGDLIKHLKKNGWTIQSPRVAYRDPIATAVPDVLFNGQGRVAAIARSKGVPATDLVQVAEDETYLDELVRAEEVFK
jgi:peptidoglycan/xylan/chitin deacetylase (PgdA/CDA1 family)